MSCTWEPPCDAETVTTAVTPVTAPPIYGCVTAVQQMPSETSTKSGVEALRMNKLSRRGHIFRGPASKKWLAIFGGRVVSRETHAGACEALRIMMAGQWTDPRCHR